ncbi:MAG TPA: PspC domain-containing protein [Thermoanaerobaculia bacterium]|jgi:phage shock protein PspC (stress-responsive transcriptional regulator)
MNCTEAVSALVASLEGSGTITDEQREHIRTCDRCRELLDSARQFQTMLGAADAPEVNVPDVSGVAEQEVHDARRRSRIIRVLIGVLIVTAFAFFAAIFASGFIDPFGADAGAELVVVVLVGAAVFAITPLLLLYFVARSIAMRSGKRLYKRLHPARWWLGVCTGLAEATKVSVGVYRLAFTILMFFDGVGLLLYVVFALAMPVHPADREYLWRFQARRLLARFRRE